MTSLLTITEAASLLGIAPCTLRRRVARNEVPHRRIFGGPIRFTSEDIEEILREAYRPVVQREEKRAAISNGYVCKWVRT